MQEKYEELESGLLVPKFAVGGIFEVQQVRDGKIIDEWESPNLVVNEGLDYILGAAMDSGVVTPITNWYVGIFETNYTPVAGVTAATIAAASTESSAFTEGVRQAWVDAGVSGQVIDNYASKATFSINATKTIYGAFLVSTSTVGGTTGTLLAASNFGAGRAVVSGDQLLVGYRLSAQDI